MNISPLSPYLVMVLALPELPMNSTGALRLIESLLLRTKVLGTNHKNNSFPRLVSVILQ